MLVWLSRFPYGEHLNEAKLNRVEQSEKFLKGLGFSEFRVRSHDELARIEFSLTEIDREFELREKIAEGLKELGFQWVSIDLEGFHSGSMNRVLSVSYNEKGLIFGIRI